MLLYFPLVVSPNVLRQIIALDTGRKLNVHKTFRRRPRRLLNVSCAFNLRPVSTGYAKHQKRYIPKILSTNKI